MSLLIFYTIFAITIVSLFATYWAYRGFLTLAKPTITEVDNVSYPNSRTHHPNLERTSRACSGDFNPTCHTKQMIAHLAVLAGWSIIFLSLIFLLDWMLS